MSTPDVGQDDPTSPDAHRLDATDAATAGSRSPGTAIALDDTTSAPARRPTWPSADAVHPDPDASYERAAAAPTTTPAEKAVVSAQIGRPARGRSAIVHRCVFGLPTVVRVDPRLEDGTPFPTVFWQTCPALSSALGRLEAEGMMVGLRERLADDDAFAAQHAAQHERYVAFRDALTDDGPLPGNPGAGGMPRGVKCLHVMAAHELATGDNAMGREALARALPLACNAPCATDGTT